jgi:hypothetical protein
MPVQHLPPCPAEAGRALGCRPNNTALAQVHGPSRVVGRSTRTRSALDRELRLATCAATMPAESTTRRGSGMASRPQPSICRQPGRHTDRGLGHEPGQGSAASPAGSSVCRHPTTGWTEGCRSHTHVGLEQCLAGRNAAQLGSQVQRGAAHPAGGAWRRVRAGPAAAAHAAAQCPGSTLPLAPGSLPRPVHRQASRLQACSAQVRLLTGSWPIRCHQTASRR